MGILGRGALAQSSGSLWQTENDKRSHFYIAIPLHWRCFDLRTKGLCRLDTMVLSVLLYNRGFALLWIFLSTHQR